VPYADAQPLDDCYWFSFDASAFRHYAFIFIRHYFFAISTCSHSLDFAFRHCQMPPPIAADAACRCCRFFAYFDYARFDCRHYFDCRFRLRFCFHACYAVPLLPSTPTPRFSPTLRQLPFTTPIILRLMAATPADFIAAIMMPIADADYADAFAAAFRRCSPLPYATPAHDAYASAMPLLMLSVSIFSFLRRR